MIGQRLFGNNNKEYTITKIISGPNRPNADVYLCEDVNGTKYIAKHFYKGRTMPNIAYGIHNHYGRRRDGSELVFKEIQDKNLRYRFLVKHIDRIKHNRKWVVIQEYVEGETLKKYIENNYSKDLPSVLKAVAELAKVLTLWHCNKFAHGDPHLDNAIIKLDTNNRIHIKLIDYSQIHHPDFHYCKEYECFNNPFTKRIEQDLVETSDKLGCGYKSDLIGLDIKFNLNACLTTEFDKYYTYPNCHL